MPEYRIGDQTIRRKNLYLPCVIGGRINEMTDEEVAAAYKAAYWADNITASEWPVVLREDGASRVAKSRLVKKAAGWLMALGRIALINPELFRAIVEKAMTMYREQIGEEHPLEFWLRQHERLETAKPSNGGRMAAYVRLVEEHVVDNGE